VVGRDTGGAFLGDHILGLLVNISRVIFDLGALTM
jgi:hypothetical protein